MDFTKFSDMSVMGNNTSEFSADLSQLYKSRAENISERFSRALNGVYELLPEEKNVNFIIQGVDSGSSDTLNRMCSLNDAINSIKLTDSSEFYPRKVRFVSGYFPAMIDSSGVDHDACIPDIKPFSEMFDGWDSSLPNFYIRNVKDDSLRYSGKFVDYLEVIDGDTDNVLGRGEVLLMKYTYQLDVFNRPNDRLFIMPNANHEDKFDVCRNIDPLSNPDSFWWCEDIGVNDICANLPNGEKLYLRRDVYGKLYVEDSHRNIAYFFDCDGPCCNIKFSYNDVNGIMNVYPWQILLPGQTEHGLLANTLEQCRVEILYSPFEQIKYVDHFCAYIDLDLVIDQISDQISRLYSTGLIFSAISESNNANDFKRNLITASSFINNADSSLLPYLNDFQNNLNFDDCQMSMLSKALSLAFTSNGDLGEVVEAANGDKDFLISSYLTQDSNVGDTAPWLSLAQGGVHILSKSSNAFISSLGFIFELPFTVSEMSWRVLNKIGEDVVHSFTEAYISPSVFKKREIGKRFIEQTKYSFRLPVHINGLGPIGDNMEDRVLYQVSIPGGYVYIIKDTSSNSIYFQIKPILLSTSIIYPVGSTHYSVYPSSVNDLISGVQMAFSNPFEDKCYVRSTLNGQITEYSDNEAIIQAQRCGLDLFVQNLAALAYDASLFTDREINLSNSQRQALSVAYETMPSSLFSRSMHRTSSYQSIQPMDVLDDIFQVDDIINNGYQSGKVIMAHNVDDSSIIDLAITNPVQTLGYFENHPSELIALTGVVCAMLVNNDTTFVGQYSITKVPDSMFALKTQNELNFGAYVWTASVVGVAVAVASVKGYFAARSAFQKSVLSNASALTVAIRNQDIAKAQKIYEKLRIQTKFGGIFGVGSLSGTLGTSSLIETMLPSDKTDLTKLSTKDDVIDLENKVNAISNLIKNQN